MSQRRWTCPKCGKGALAPGKPRKDDVRRYCLPCSKKTGRLVTRECLSLERERADAKRQRDERAKRQRAAATRKRTAHARDRRQKEFVGAGVARVALRALLRRWSGLKAWTLPGWVHHHRGKVNLFVRHGHPELLVRRGKAQDDHWHPAHAWSGHRITMTIPRHWDDDPLTPARKANLLMTLLHEMAHLAVGRAPRGADGRREAHGDLFNQLFCAAAEEVWGIEVGYRYGDGGYAPSRRVQELLRQRLEEEL
jgi:hypothetical protein